MKRLFTACNTRIGLLLWLIFFIWIKTVFAYFFVMNSLHSINAADYILMILNPIGFTAIFFSLTLFIKRTPLFYLAVGILDFLGSLLVYGNVLYYREFSDFLSVNTISGGAGMMGQGFDFGSIPVHPLDIFYWLDFVVIILLFAFKKIKFDTRPVNAPFAFKFFSLALMVFTLNFWAGDWTEHQLVSRQANYDDTYVVRYLGFGPWLVTNGWYNHLTNQARQNADKDDFTKVQQYIATNRYLAPNVQYEGIAKGKNLIVIHLESFQQDLINMKINGQPVTPFLNSLYNNTYSSQKSVFAYSNFFNQVGQGKTSDAENMLETSTFGLPTGSLFAQDGGIQTFQAMPSILNQTQGYSSAVFHGNVGSFYNRINTYRNMGYQNFFDQSFYNTTPTNSTAWGLKDKWLFYDSVPYLEQLQQPFYVKYLTVTNHISYNGLNEDELDPNFKTTNSGYQEVDDYFLTAHYLDQSVQEFFNYLKASGLYNKSIIVLYGDHYGMSGSDDKYFAPFLNGGDNISLPTTDASSSGTTKSSSTTTASNTGAINATTWNDYYDTMMQRVPFMIDIPGRTDGGINNEYAGEIDVMPTLEHLLGINTSKYVQFGQDMFAQNRQDFVALRNRGFVTPTITKPSATSTTYYDTNTGTILTLTPAQQTYVNDVQNKVNTLLDMSDTLNTEDLLRFYTPSGFTPVKASNFSYSVESTKKRLASQQQTLKNKSTSLLSLNKGISTQDLFKTNEPGIPGTSYLPPTKTSSSSASSSSKSKGGN